MQQLTRRHFLRRLGIATGTALTAQALVACRNMGNAPRIEDQAPHVVILGAGLAGLSAAYELQRKGYRTTILEADRSHIGGRVRTLRFSGGLYGEAGAMRIPAKHELTRAYCKEFNLTLRPFVQSNQNAWFFARNTKVRRKDEATLRSRYKLSSPVKEHPNNEVAMSSDDMWSVAVIERLKKLSDVERGDILATTPSTAGFKTLDQLSLQNLFDQAGFSQEAIEFMAVTQGQEAEMQYGADESLREELKEIWAHEFDEIVGGTDTLATAFVNHLTTADIRRGCQVIALTQNPLSATAIYQSNGRRESITADAIICTLPAPVMQRLDAPFTPAKARAIRQLTYDSASKLLIGARRRFWELDDGIYGGGTFTDLPSGSTYYPADNATDRAGAGPRDPALSRKESIFLASYTWGMAARRLAAIPHAQRLALIRQHLSKVHPQLADDSMITQSASWAWDTHPWSGGAFAWFNPGQHTALYADLIAADGRIHFAGEHASLTHTWMQGAFESALRVVGEIAARGR